jgi:ATP-binding cassette subfamily E protein 1
MATYMADKVIVFDGIPAKESRCSEPENLVTGMNRFLKMMDITFRRDPTNYRPRINKMDSQKDQIQKSEGNYFLMEETSEQKERKKKLAAEKAAKEAEEKKDEGEETKQEDNKDKKKAKGKKKKENEDDWV